MTTNSSGLLDNLLAPEELERRLAIGDVLLADVREPFEFSAEHIPGAASAPLSAFDPVALRKRAAGRLVVLQCRSGKRSAEAAQRFAATGESASQLAGGIEAWKQSGRRTARASGAPRIDVMRQTQIVIGSFVLGGALLGAFVSPWFLIVPAFMGSGLIYAGASGSCGMALMLARMPWNRAASRPASSDSRH